MEFRFSEEQEMMRNAAEDFLAEFSSSARVRTAMADPAGFQPEDWQRICSDMGWQGMHIPEQHGGLGLGYVELAAVLEPMGRRLLGAPFFSTVCLAATTLLASASSPQAGDFLAAISAGQLCATLATSERPGGWRPEALQSTAQRHGDGYRLSGAKYYVPDGHSADMLLISARAPGSRGSDGISLFAVPADQPGLRRKALPTMDQTRKQAALEFHRMALPAAARIGEEGAAGEVLQRVLDLAAVALAAEQVGGAQETLDSTLRYTLERRQFRRPIASFQAVKHKCADMMLRVETARSAACYAACVADEYIRGGALGEELPLAASLAKCYCSEAYFQCAAEALQLHGGTGFCWEYDVHLYFKRARAGEIFLASPDWHRERIASLLQLEGAAS